MARRKFKNKFFNLITVITMKEKNTKTTPGFIGECCFFSAVPAVWYLNLMFRRLPGKTRAASCTVLLLLIGAAALTSALLLNRSRKNGWTALMTILFPFGLYTVRAYAKTYPWFTAVPRVLAVLAAGYAVLLCCVARRADRRTRRRLWRRWSLLLQAATAVFFAAVLAVIGVPAVLRNDLVEPSAAASVPAASAAQTAGQPTDGDAAVLLPFREEAWQQLSLPQRVDALQALADLEARYFGLPHGLRVGADNLTGGAEACYTDALHTVSFDLTYLENAAAAEALTCCCHEARHAYQNALAALYPTAEEGTRQLLIFRQAAQYDAEFHDYADGARDFLSYYAQACETDARAYAAAAADYYTEALRRYQADPAAFVWPDVWGKGVGCS